MLGERTHVGVYCNAKYLKPLTMGLNLAKIGILLVNMAVVSSSPADDASSPLVTILANNAGKVNVTAISVTSDFILFALATFFAADSKALKLLIRSETSNAMPSSLLLLLEPLL